jgi:hypothetical protein
VIVVADTSVLINLACVEQIDLLRSLFHEVVIPPEVAAEFKRLAANVPRFKGLIVPVWIRQQSPATISPMLTAIPGLDIGETAAISLAIEIHADAILIDERRGNAAAANFGLKTVGVFGILIQAKAAGFMPEIRSVIDRLQRDAGFFMTPTLRNRVLKIAGE